jgi:putative membrane protein
MKKYLVLFFVMISGLLASCAGYRCFGPEDPREWGLMMHYGFGYGGMFMWIIFLIVIGMLVYFVVRDQQTKGQTPTQESPLDILKMRYAKGEVTKEEYERMKKDLES